jgi:hypothetical protein
MNGSGYNRFIRTWASIAREPMGVCVARSILFSGRHLKGPKCLRFRTFIRTSNGPSARLRDCLCGHRRHDIFEFPRVEGECDGSLYSPVAKSEQVEGRSSWIVTSLVKLTFIMAPNFPSVSRLALETFLVSGQQVSHLPLIFSGEYCVPMNCRNEAYMACDLSADFQSRE